jgi:hypothetical protein
MLLCRVLQEFLRKHKQLYNPLWDIYKKENLEEFIELKIY